MHIGLKIRKLRKENKNTLKELAEKIDYDWSNLSKVERGAYGVTHELLQKIIDVYNVSPSYFLGQSYDGDEPPGLGKRYKFIVDDVEATEREIVEAIRIIRHFRSEED